MHRDGLKYVTHKLGQYGENVRVSMMVFLVMEAILSGPSLTAIEIQRVEQEF